MAKASKKKNKSGGAGGLLAVAAGAAVLLVGGSVLAAQRSKAEPAKDEPTDDASKRSTPPKPWKAGPGGKGKVFGGGGGAGGGGAGELPENLPEGFDYGGNGLYVDPECQYVIEGNLFWGDNWSAVEAETLAETLAIADNSVVGFIDYLVDTAGTTDPEGVAWTILEEVSPMCTAVDTSMWGEGLINWYDNFLARVVEYLDSFIGFDPNDLDPDDDEAGGDIEEPLA